MSKDENVTKKWLSTVVLRLKKYCGLGSTRQTNFLRLLGTIRFAYPVERGAIYQIYNRGRSAPCEGEFPKEDRFTPI